MDSNERSETAPNEGAQSSDQQRRRRKRGRGRGRSSDGTATERSESSTAEPTRAAESPASSGESETSTSDRRRKRGRSGRGQRNGDEARNPRADSPQAEVRTGQHERQPQERQPQERQPQDRQPQERQPQDRRPQDRQQQDRQPQDRQPQDRQPQDRQPQDRQPQDRSGKKRDRGQRKPREKADIASQPGSLQSRMVRIDGPREDLHPEPYVPVAVHVKAATVAEYIAQHRGWQRDVLGRLAELVRKTCPEATESIKWSQPVFEFEGPLCYLKAFTNHINFGFWRGSELSDPSGLLEGDGLKLRHVRIENANDVNVELFEGFIRLAVRLNREKGDPTLQ